MKKTTILIIAVLLMSPAAASANLLTNPGFETGNFSGWTPSIVGLQTVLNSNPNSGQYEARIYQYGQFSQNVNVTPNTTYKLSSFLYMPQDGGNASISITFYNATGTTSFQQERSWERYPGNQQYDKIETDWLVAPSYTAYAKVQCSVTTAGSYIDFDDVSLDVIPEPSSLLLLFTGITGLFGLLTRPKGV
jgi:hypothetical protein